MTDRALLIFCALAALASLVALSGCAAVPKPRGAIEPAAVAVGAAAPAIAAVDAKPIMPAMPPVSADTQARFERALQAQRAGRHDDALNQWTALAQAHPELGGAHANLGLLHRQAGRHAEAVAALERAAQASPNQPRFFNELGIACRHAGQFAKAQQAYESALAIDPHHDAALLNLGILHDLYLGNGAKALALYERYLALPSGGDAGVTKWAAELRKRKPADGAPATAAATQSTQSMQVAKSNKEQP